ncbi:hypothetical protein [Streptomyces sp. NPDC018610]|uniref:hypothetical protein n=1 Tax=Streptomyces sp. NPDC018610 TaxID=3365049 RepID=UPI0037AA9FD3
MSTGNKIYYHLTDAIGSVIGLVDRDGNKVDTYTYSPRGVACSPSPASRSPSPAASSATTRTPPACIASRPVMTTPASAASPSPTPRPGTQPLQNWLGDAKEVKDLVKTGLKAL